MTLGFVTMKRLETLKRFAVCLWSEQSGLCQERVLGPAPDTHTRALQAAFSLRTAINWHPCQMIAKITVHGDFSLRVGIKLEIPLTK